jgi:hypothetical protein
MEDKLIFSQSTMLIITGKLMPNYLQSGFKNNFYNVLHQCLSLLWIMAAITVFCYDEECSSYKLPKM